MRQLFGIVLLLWAAASAYFAYGSYFVAGTYRSMGWSYIEYPLRQAFGESNQTSEANQAMWALAIKNARAFDPQLDDSPIALAGWIADPLVTSASKHLHTNFGLWAANAAITLIAAVFLIWSGNEVSRGAKAAS